MTAEFFERQIERLKPLGAASDEFKDAYWDALHDLPADVFDAAISHALKTRTWFPKPAELRIDADTVAPLVRPPLPDEDRSRLLDEPFTVTLPDVGTLVSVTREWKYYDERCSDSGWASWWCGDPTDRRRAPWMEIGRCDRHGEHGPHEYVTRCACWESNPALVRKRANQQRYAEKPGKAA